MKNIGEEDNGLQFYACIAKFILRISKFKFLKMIDLHSHLICLIIKLSVLYYYSISLNYYTRISNAVIIFIQQ
jgi:hypothetical protein